MERPLRVSKLRLHEHKNDDLVFGEALPLLLALENSDGDISVLFDREEPLGSLVFAAAPVSIGIGDDPLGSPDVVQISLAATVEERGTPGVVEEPSAASSDSPESAVSSADFGVVRLIRGGRLLQGKRDTIIGHSDNTVLTSINAISSTVMSC